MPVKIFRPWLTQWTITQMDTFLGDFYSKLNVNYYDLIKSQCLMVCIFDVDAAVESNWERFTRVCKFKFNISITNMMD